MLLIRSSMVMSVVLMLGCSTGVRDASPYLHRALAPGDRLLVSETIRVARGTRTVHLQNGALRPAIGLTIWHPSCRLVLVDVADADFAITGGSWEIRGFRLFEQDTSFDTLTTSTVIQLVSEDRPAVESLICERAYGMNAFQSVPAYITRDEFHQAVGRHVSLGR